MNYVNCEIAEFASYIKHTTYHSHGGAFRVTIKATVQAERARVMQYHASDSVHSDTA